jgi:hypothetical protein
MAELAKQATESKVLIMPKTKPTWNDKLQGTRPPQIKRIIKAFADVPEGALMLISCPQNIDEAVKSIPRGHTLSLKELRTQLAKAADAECTCPVTTGIFLRVVAEAAWERHQAGVALAKITPFWRAIDPSSGLAKKLSCGVSLLVEQRAAEAS